MYSCGPTVYDHIHIGNLRAYLLPDLIKRLLYINNFEVENTINFTDFGHLTDDGDAGEDKMMKALKRNDMPITLEAMSEVAVPYIESFKKDLTRLNILEPSHYTRASEYVEKQIELISKLLEGGLAYKTSDGVYFDIKKYKNYGILGNVDIENAKAVARVEVNTEKKNPADFALWKNAELGWESNWGKGFPGWHIECTAMIFDTLGEQIDIHTGGEDLKFTHHNGEIAQAEALTKKKFVSYWLHNAFVTINDKKFAKSQNNSITLTDLEEKGYDPLAYRYLLLNAHYRSTLNFSFESLDSAAQAHQKLRRFVYDELNTEEEAKIPSNYEEEFFKRSHNDLDTCAVISLLWEVVKDKKITDSEKYATILLIDSFLGIGLSEDVEEGKKQLGFLKMSELPEEIADLVDKREIARIAQNWQEADKYRDILTQKGYTVEDTAEVPRVYKVQL